jgi:putative aldouronate transport system permease protein
MRATRKNRSAFLIFNQTAMLVLCALFLYPLVYTISMSMSSAKAILEGRVYLLPVERTFEAYKTMLRDKTIINAFFFTVRLTVSGVSASVVMTVLTAYPLSKNGFRRRNLFLKLIVATMYFSGGIIPTYLLVKNLGLTNTMGALIVPNVVDTFLLIITISYFRELPFELEESARLDGCSNFAYLIHFAVPLSMAVIATLTVFYAVSYWNTFFNALIYMQSPSKYTLQIKLYQILNVFTDSMTNQLSTESALVVIPENLKGATVTLTVLPILVVYPFMQRYFIKGVTIGALKG